MYICKTNLKKNNIMNSSNLHLKIEMKGKVKPSKMYELLFDVKKSIVYQCLLKTIEKDFFKLPYQVKKLSKKARRKQ